MSHQDRAIARLWPCSRHERMKALRLFMMHRCLRSSIILFHASPLPLKGVEFRIMFLGWVEFHLNFYSPPQSSSDRFWWYEVSYELSYARVGPVCRLMYPEGNATDRVRTCVGSSENTSLQCDVANQLRSQSLDASYGVPIEVHSQQEQQHMAEEVQRSNTNSRSRCQSWLQNGYKEGP